MTSAWPGGETPAAPGGPVPALPYVQGLQVGAGNVQHNNYGPITFHPGAGVSTGLQDYLAEVGEIAPAAELLDRRYELAQLDDFCTGPGPYRWLYAPAWAGKSALLAWWVLHRKAEVDVVSFFIRTREYGKASSGDFLAVVIAQLEELLGRSPDPQLRPAAAAGRYLNLLRAAAHHAARRERHLVLVVDGLDADESRTVEQESIASLLPRGAVEGLKVIVSSRRLPSETRDLHGDHPARCDPDAVRSLRASVHAGEIREFAEAELDVLLDGTREQRALLGLLTAAGGGLSGPDLDALLGIALDQRSAGPHWIAKTLQGVTGRSFVRDAAGRLERTTRYDPQAGYRLGHDELRSAAIEAMGAAALAGYRATLLVWADSYRDAGWPADTPSYLLHEYADLLAAGGDEERQLQLAEDAERHERLLSRPGGIASAMREITAGCRMLAGRVIERPDEVGDLPRLAALAGRRHDLGHRRGFVPTGLPAVWAALGRVPHAQRLAAEIEDPRSHAEALARIASAVPDDHRSASIAAAALTSYRRLPAAGHPPTAGLVARALAAVGEVEQAWSLADGLSGDWCTAARRQVVEAITRSGRRVEAIELARKLPVDAGASLIRAAATAEPVDHRAAWADAASITHPGRRAQALAELVQVVAPRDLDLGVDIACSIRTEGPASGRVRMHAVEGFCAAARAAGARDAELARSLAGEAHETAVSIHPAEFRTTALARATEAWAAIGDLDVAEQAAALIGHAVRRARALTVLVRAAADGPDHQRVTDLVHQVQCLAAGLDDPDRLRRLAELAQALAPARPAAATVIAREVRVEARAIPDQAQRRSALSPVIVALVAAGERAEAADVVRGEAATAGAMEFVETVVGPLVGRGEFPTAEELVALLPSRADQAALLTRLAELSTESTHGERAAGRAEELARRAEAMARSVADEPDEKSRDDRVVASIGEAVAIGHLDSAIALTAELAKPERRAMTQRWLAKTLIEEGDLDRALGTITEIEHPYWLAFAHGDLVEAFAGRKDTTRAARLARAAAAAAEQVEDPAFRVQAYAHVIAAVSRALGRDEASRWWPNADAAAAGLAGEPASKALTALAVAYGDHRSPDSAVRLLDGILDPPEKVRTLIKIAACRGLGRSETVAMVQCAHAMVRDNLDDAAQRAAAFARLAEVLAAAGELGYARKLNRIAGKQRELSADEMAVVRARQAAFEASLGNDRRAEELAEGITHPGHRSEAFAGLALSLGRPDLMSRAADVAASIEPAARRDAALAAILSRAEEADDRALAERVARMLADRTRRGTSLAGLAVAAATAGDLPHSRRLTAEALLDGAWPEPLKALGMVDRGGLRAVAAARSLSP